MRKLFKPLHLRLTKWIRNKYRRYRKKNWYCAFQYLQQISKSYPYLFEHWKYEGLRPQSCVLGFEEPYESRGSSRQLSGVSVRGLGGEIPPYLLDFIFHRFFVLSTITFLIKSGSSILFCSRDTAVLVACCAGSLLRHGNIS